jgi:hypothetical protein
MTCEYLREFSKKFDTVQMGYSGAGGKLIHKITRSKNSRDTVHLTRGQVRGPAYGVSAHGLVNVINYYGIT